MIRSSSTNSQSCCWYHQSLSGSYETHWSIDTTCLACGASPLVLLRSQKRFSICCRRSSHRPNSSKVRSELLCNRTGTDRITSLWHDRILLVHHRAPARQIRLQIWSHSRNNMRKHRSQGHRSKWEGARVERTRRGKLPRNTASLATNLKHHRS